MGGSNFSIWSFRVTKPKRGVFVTLMALLISAGIPGTSSASEAPFQAGSSAVDITPETLPVRVNGYFTERTVDVVKDPLYARAVALNDGESTLVFCIVDTCMMAQDLIDQAKSAVSEATGLAMDRMMVSATHTHSAPSAMACLGSRIDPGYAAWLPGKIAEAIEMAMNNLQPARVGWASIDDWGHTHHRRWIRRADKTFDDPFGNKTVRAHMHPGFLSKDVIGPSGPVDPGLSLLAAQSLDGKPIALLANYAPHFYGTAPLSADYYGVFCKEIAKLLGQKSDKGPFVPMMSQGTSGDLSSRDYHGKRAPASMEAYGAELAARALEAYETIEWHTQAPLAVTEKTLTLDYRVPDADRVAWARERMAALGDALPTSQPDIYAQEALILHERQRTAFTLQAIRIGSLSIAAFPNEVYAITGLKLKLQAPFDDHFNIELANGAVGYIPPPEQHALGGYTTWPARTAGLEVQAEPIVVEALLSALEEISGKKRKPIIDEDGPYAVAIKAKKPIAYWRLNEIEGRIAHSALADGPKAQISGGVALYLPGVATGSGGGAQQQLQPSNFSGPNQYNRALHFVADGRLEANVPNLDGDASVAFWFWLGEASGLSVRNGTLCTLPSGDALRYAIDETGEATVSLVPAANPKNTQTGPTRLAGGKWHFAVLTAAEGSVSVFVDGQSEADATIALSAPLGGAPLRFAKGLEGKLDEIAVYNRVLSSEEQAALWKTSGIEAFWAKEIAKRERLAQEAAERVKAPTFPADYTTTTAALKPTTQAHLNAPQDGLRLESGVEVSPETFAVMTGGRIRGQSKSYPSSYSVSLWFNNTLANDARAVTAYLFSYGAKNGEAQVGDHLGIGGTYQNALTGKIILFNGDTAGQVIQGKTTILPETWNHLVLVRDGDRVITYLNGEADMEGEIAATGNAPEFFLGARSDTFASLSGYLAEFALFDRALSADEAKVIHAASGQPVGTATAAPTPPEAAPLRLESPPLAPADALASIHVPEGFTVDLVAVEPQVLDPVAFDWDTQGRLWVVEMADYPLGLGDNNAAGGRVRMLEDRDQDGTYETSQLFADGLNFPTGILTWRDGVIVTAAPDILFLKDSTGDGTADVREVLFTGLTEGNQQLRANGLRWGLDNWVYVAAGGHHGKHGASTRLESSRAGTVTPVGSRDFRFRPDTGLVEPQSGPAQFGRNRDDWGRWFGTQNSNPLWHYGLADHYLKRNPYLAAPNGKVQVLGESNPKVYPASSLQKRYHNFQQAGRYTSACSGMIYRDAALFPAWETNAFVCEPFQNLVQRIVLHPEGATFSGKQISAPDAPDFFASTDRWCRPVMVRTGPDGALWVADMYRYMIEHPDWLPEKGKKELLPFYREGDGRGRIYRVRRTTAAPQPAPTLENLDTALLVAQLESANGWIRDKVQQLLLWRDDRSAVPLLTEMASKSSAPLARLHALCTLDGLNALPSELVVIALGDPHPGVRENALRLAETRFTPEVVTAALALKTDGSAMLRKQLAYSLGAFPTSPEVGQGLATLLLKDHDDSFISTAALSSALPHQDHLINVLIASNDPALPALRQTLTEMALAAGNLESVAALLTPVFATALASPSQEAATASAAILDLLTRRGSSVSKISANVSAGPLFELGRSYDRLVSNARQIMANEDAPAASRISAATVLSRIPADEAKVVDYLASRLEAWVPPEELRQTLTTLSHTSDARVPGLLIEAWSGFAPKAREQVADVLLSQTPWTRHLLDAIGAGTIPPTDLAPVRRTRLLNLPDEELRTLATTYLVAETNPERAEVIAHYAPALTLPGDVDRGRAKYIESCASCHKSGDLGINIGPDFSSVAEHPKEKLLANIIDPNLDIQPGYHAYNCELEDGEQLFGLIASENATSITMKLPGGILRKILRNDIYSLESTTISMMPEGWEESLDHQGMADLIAFLKVRP